MIHQINHLDLEQKAGLKQMIIYGEQITSIVKLNLRLRPWLKIKFMWL